MSSLYPDLIKELADKADAAKLFALTLVKLELLADEFAIEHDVANWLVVDKLSPWEVDMLIEELRRRHVIERSFSGIGVAP